MDEDIERVHEKATCSAFVLTSDGIDDVTGKLVGIGLKRSGFLLHDEAKSLTETMGELVGILVGDMRKVMLADGGNRGCFDYSLRNCRSVELWRGIGCRLDGALEGGLGCDHIGTC